MRASHRRIFSALAALAALAAVPVLAGCSSKHGPRDEDVRREAYVRDLVAREGIKESFGVTSSPEVHYEWGFSRIEYDPEYKFRSHAFRWFGQRAVIRLKSHGDKPMHLLITGWVDHEALRTKPTISLYLDGQFLSSATVENGGFGIGGTIPREMLRKADWVTLNIDMSSVGWHWLDAPGLRVALVSSLEWKEE